MSSDVHPEHGDELLSAAAAGKILGRHRTTVYRWAAEGWIPSVQLPNRKRMFRRNEMERVAQEMREQSLAEPSSVVA